MSLQIKSMAVMLVANGHVLIAVSNPSSKTVNGGISLCSNISCRKSIAILIIGFFL